jgi:hypothetical protein
MACHDLGRTLMTTDSKEPKRPVGWVYYTSFPKDKPTPPEKHLNIKQQISDFENFTLKELVQLYGEDALLLEEEDLDWEFGDGQRYLTYLVSKGVNVNYDTQQVQYEKDLKQYNIELKQWRKWVTWNKAEEKTRHDAEKLRIYNRLKKELGLENG